MDLSNVGRADDRVVLPPSPPPEPREAEREIEAETSAPEPPADSGTRLDLFA
jgi:hypothetical protein